MSEHFRTFAERAAHAVGSYWAFMLALLVVVIWAATGPIFNYSDTWQLIMNTGTTIVTFLMVFLIQNTQNRETRIVTLKLDELLRGVEIRCRMKSWRAYKASSRGYGRSSPSWLTTIWRM